MALLGNLKGSAQAFIDPKFYNTVATQSLRFNDDDSAYLSRTPSSASNRDLWTLSLWVKRSNVGTSGTQSLYGVYADSNNQETLAFDSGGSVDKLYWQLYQGGSAVGQLTTNRVFRDVSSWYHIVIAYDSANSTAGNRMRMYINGVEETSFATDTNPSSGLDSQWNSTTAHTIGRISTTNYFDGYIAEVNSVDGQALDASYFGETKNGVWIPKGYSGSYGTNGFRLEFKNTSVGSGSSSTIGADTSSNNNHFTSTNIVASDCAMPDSPENNFATWNSIAPDPTYGITTFSEGNLKSLNTPNNNKYSEINFRLDQTNKYYFEYYNISNTAALQPANFEIQDEVLGASNRVYFYLTDTGTINVDGSSIGTSFPTLSAGDIVNIAFDGTTGKVWFGKNGTYYNASGSATGNPADGTNPIATLTPATFKMFSVFYQQGAIMNFGQDSSFAGNKTAQGNTDTNGIGDFYYAVPSGYLALCTANLPEPTIGPNSLTQADDHFNTVTFSGTGSSPLSVTGVGFQPDLLWMKRRNGGTNGNNILYDSSRGGTNALRSNTTGSESQFGDMVVTFASDGFSFTGTDGLNAGSDYSNVAWNWKANGGTKTTNDASATSVGSIDSDIQANTTAGFSIVQYETNSGTSGSSQTVAHGLSQAPTFMIVKSRDQSGTSWMVYYGDNTDYLRLESNGATIDGLSTWNDTSPTSTVFSIGTNGGDTNNTSGGSMISYIFHDVEGYSKFSSYTGNGNADGTFVYTGFRPAWVLLKDTDNGDWLIYDAVRTTSNLSDKFTQTNNSEAENTTSSGGIDILSNGFKNRNTFTNLNSNGNTYIYAAFAEQPFKYANAR